MSKNDINIAAGMCAVNKDTGDIYKIEAARTPHFDWLHDAATGGNYALCGIDNKLISIKDDVYTFEEVELVGNDPFTVIEFADGEAWLQYVTIQPFEAGV